MSRKATWKYVTSSVIDKVWWNAETEVMHVIFLSGSYYIYEDITLYRYYQFRNAKSKGKYFNKYIKSHNYRRMS